MKEVKMMKKYFYFFFVLFLCLANPIHSEEREPELHVCTVASEVTAQLKQLLTSAKKQKIKIDVLGLGLPYMGNGHKLIYVREYLKKISDDDIVLFVDGYDVLLLANKQTILKKFFKTGAPFVISAEQTCFPFRHLESKYPPSPTPFRYINTGSYIGYAWFIKQLLKDMAPIKAHECDQGQMTLYYFKHRDQFYLDYYCHLFLPLHGVTKKDLKLNVKSRSVYCRITKSTPCLVHGNGQSKRFYQRIYDVLLKKK